MNSIILNIITAAITTTIGIFAGRQMKIYDLRQRMKKQEQRLAMAKYQSEYFRSEYLRMLRPNYKIVKNDLIKKNQEINKEKSRRIDIVENQAGRKTKKVTEEKQLEIINHYGMEKQLDQLLEESGELIVAIAKSKRYSLSDTAVDHYENLVEEMADVKNLIEQIELKSPYIKDGIEVMTRHKAERELDRIRRSEDV